MAAERCPSKKEIPWAAGAARLALLRRRSTVIGCSHTRRASVGASRQGAGGLNARGAPRRIRQQPQGGNHEGHNQNGHAQVDCGVIAGGETHHERAAEPHP